jgi:predicted metal-binding membrane protein
LIAKGSLPFEALLRHERAATLLLLAAVIGFSAWGVLAKGHSLMPAPGAWAGGAATLFLMWSMMMAAMMLPSATPAILTFTAISARMSRQSAAPWHPAAFIAGYLAVWSGFSGLAVAAHLALIRFGMMPDLMALSSSSIGGALLIAAGAWQLTPLKHTCLIHCQSPFFYLARHWRRGGGGAFVTGFRHGLYCLGCCWVLMALLFYGGTMSIAWIGGLAVYVLLEKTLPRRCRLERLAGIFLIVWGAATLTGALAPAANQ